MPLIELIKRLICVSQAPMPKQPPEPEPIPEPKIITPADVAAVETPEKADPKDVLIVRLQGALKIANEENVRAWKYARDLSHREVTAWKELRSAKMEIRQALNELHIWLNLNF